MALYEYTVTYDEDNNTFEVAHTDNASVYDSHESDPRNPENSQEIATCEWVHDTLIASLNFWNESPDDNYDEPSVEDAFFYDSPGMLEFT